MPDRMARPYLITRLEETEESIRHFRFTLDDKGSGNVQSEEDQYPESNRNSFQQSGNKSGSLRKEAEQSMAEKEEDRTSLHHLPERGEETDHAVDSLPRMNQKYSKEYEKLKSEVKALREKNQELCLRLSELTCEKLTANNPNIADLSDPYRPTKLGEMISELYDNEWTNAFEALQSFKNDDSSAVQILLDTFMDVLGFCKEKSSSLFSMPEKSAKALFEDFNKTVKTKRTITKTRSSTVLCRSAEKGDPGVSGGRSFEGLNIIFLEWRDKRLRDELEETGTFQNLEDVWPKLDGKLMGLRKDFGVALIPIVTKAYLKPRWSKSCVKALKPYIKKCVQLAWMMCVQTPPMVTAPLPRHDQPFDTTLYRCYKRQGAYVEFVVWPAVLLHEPRTKTEQNRIICKGVIQGKDL